MKISVIIQVVENGYVMTYREPTTRPSVINQYIPTTSSEHITYVERNIITTSEEEIASILKELREKLFQ